MGGAWVLGRGGIASCCLILDTIWRRLFSLTLSCFNPFYKYWDGLIYRICLYLKENTTLLRHRYEFEIGKYSLFVPIDTQCGQNAELLTWMLKQVITVWKSQSCPTTRHEGAWGERKYSSYSFLTSALDRGERSASRFGRSLLPGKGPPGTHCTGGWVGPRAGLDTEARGKNHFSSAGDRTSIARSSSP
jgi:hypothetical protein